jgi:formylglycine-generating enzyme required for sulfatase activity
VEDVTWDDVQLFLQKLNARSGGARYRLPTEAEWEYAARGGVQSRGTRYAGSNNVDEVAWRSSYDGGTHPVKGKRANELGLYDMSGNVWEWCADWYGSDYYAASTSFNPTGPSTSGYFRVLRGGSWCDALHEQNNNGSQPDFPAYCRVTFRNFEGPDYRTYCVGFRLARTF